MSSEVAVYCSCAPQCNLQPANRRRRRVDHVKHTSWFSNIKDLPVVCATTSDSLVAHSYHYFVRASLQVVEVLARARMFTARKKIAKEKGQEPDSFEESVAQVLFLTALCTYSVTA